MLAAVPVDGQGAAETKLAASDGASGDGFGYVALSGDIAVVGAPRKDDFGTDSGVAYVFVRIGSTWLQEAKLVPSDRGPGILFGFAVGVSGTTAVIGAPERRAAYVFVRTASGWSEQAKLTVDDGVLGDEFAQSVSISGDTVVVGAPGFLYEGYAGAAYVFVRSGTTWTREAKMTPTGGREGDRFGKVSVSESTVVVGAWGNDSAKGAAHVFVRTGSTWTEEARLVANDVVSGDGFGWSVSVSGDTAVIAAPFQGLGYDSSKGAGYVFVRTGATWTQQAKLLASDGAPGDLLGQASVSGDTVVLGATGEDDRGTSSGSAYVFHRSGTTWSEHAKLTASDAAPLDWFGSTVGVDGNTVIIGSLGHDGRGPDSGAAYVFDLESGPDSSEPTITIISPTRGLTVTTPVVTVSGTAVDDVAVRSVEISTDGVTWYVVAGTVSWSGIVSLREGTNTISVRATDTSENVAIESIDVTVVLPVTSQGPPTWLPFAGIAVVLAVTVAWAIVYRARRRTRPPSP